MNDLQDIEFDDGGVNAPPPNKASIRTLKYFGDLVRDRDPSAMLATMPDAWRDMFNHCERVLAVKTVEQIYELGAWTQADISRFIGQLSRQPLKPKPQFPAGTAPVSQAIEQDGMYKNGDRIYQVYWNREGSRLLARELLFDKVNREGKNVYKWEYRGQAYRFVRPDQRMELTLEEAREFGAMYSRCSQCGRTLNDPLSVELGIGPICGDRDFGGDFKFMLKAAKDKLGLK